MKYDDVFTVDDETFNVEDYITEVPDFPVKGVNFKDISPLLADQETFRSALVEMGRQVRLPDYWVGIDARGFLFAGALSYEFGGGLVMCRKKGKLPPPVESYTYQLEYGEDTLEMKRGEGKVVIVDDVYATGGTAKATRELCNKAGYDVVDEIFLINLVYINKNSRIKSVIKYN